MHRSVTLAFPWMIVLAACRPTERTTVLDEGGDRLVAETRDTGGFPDPTVSFRLSFTHRSRDGERTTLLAKGDLEKKRFRPKATRLPSGAVGFHVTDMACQMVDLSHAVCADLWNLVCPMEGDSLPSCCNEVERGAVSCACGIAHADARATEALLWVAEDPEQRPTQRIAAVAALGRIGRGAHAPRALAVIAALPDAANDAWLVAARTNLSGDGADALRARLAAGNRCDTIAILRSCVQGIDDGLAKARASIGRKLADDIDAQCRDVTKAPARSP